MNPFRRVPWRHYVYAFRDILDMWAVWPPGCGIEVGDYGVVERGRFERRGGIREFIELSSDDVKISDARIDLQLGGWRNVRAETEANAYLAEGAEASAILDVKRSRGVFMRLNGLSEQEFRAQRLIKDSLTKAVGRKRQHWDSDWLIVHRVFSASSFSAVVTASKSTDLRVRGSADVLRALKLGELSGGAGLRVEGATVLSVFGEEGPVALGLSPFSLRDDSSRGFMAEDLVRMDPLRPQEVEFPELEEDH